MRGRLYIYVFVLSMLKVHSGIVYILKGDFIVKNSPINMERTLRRLVFVGSAVTGGLFAGGSRYAINYQTIDPFLMNKMSEHPSRTSS